MRAVFHLFVWAILLLGLTLLVLSLQGCALYQTRVEKNKGLVAQAEDLRAQRRAKDAWTRCVTVVLSQWPQNDPKRQTVFVTAEQEDGTVALFSVPAVCGPYPGHSTFGIIAPWRLGTEAFPQLPLVGGVVGALETQ